MSVNLKSSGLYATLKPYIIGAASYLPRLGTSGYSPTGGTDSPRYCYSVWFRHLVALQQCRRASIPEVVAEFGPGDSLGTGLAALLSGARKYYALDIHEYAFVERNQEMLDGLVDLFLQNAAIPDDSEFPRVRPRLADYRMPSDLIPRDAAAINVSAARVAKIRSDLASCDERDCCVQYIVPWMQTDKLPEKSIDMIFSQSALQYLADLESVFQSMHRWLKTGGTMSHVIDFSGHCHFRRWNDHWGYSTLAWTIIKGRRPYFINRAPLSWYVRALERSGFRIVNVLKESRPSALQRSQLAAPFRNLSDEDLCTANALIQAVKVG